MSDEVKSFISNCGRFEFTVKEEFFKRCNPQDWDVYDLNTKFRLSDYLHNPKGIAIKILFNGHEEVWLNGKKLDEEDARKFLHQLDFNDRIESLKGD